MTAKFGFASQTNSVTSTKSNPVTSNSNRILIRVDDVVLDENHPYIKQTNDISMLGMVIGTSIGNSLSTSIYNAIPKNSNYTNPPLVGEYVYISPVQSPNSTGTQFMYDEPVSLYGNTSVNSNSTPSILEKEKNNPLFNSPSNPSQQTFVEKPISPLMPFPGDILIEGRFGQSLRFGNTSKSKSKYGNSWSNSGENGDPITILRNGQPDKLPKENGIPITENPTFDKSSITLTSTQKLPIKLSNENFTSYTTPPKTPSEYNKPQAIISSDRIIINAKSDEVMVSAYKSVFISSNESINVESNKTYIESPNIYLGSKDAIEKGLLGTSTVKVLDQLFTALVTLTSVLESSQIYPGGVPVPDAPLNLAAINVTTILNQLLSKIKDPKQGILSNIVKIK